MRGMNRLDDLAVSIWTNCALNGVWSVEWSGSIDHTSVEGRWRLEWLTTATSTLSHWAGQTM